MRVCIIQPVMKAYRAPFFEQLARALQQRGISLVVQYGRPWPAERLRGDNITLAPPLGHETANLRLAGARVLLQPTWRPWWGADLVVIEHANKHLHNFALNALRGRAFGRLAYWGHGRNRQGDAASIGEHLKRRSLHWVDWWFAYTAGAAAYIAAQGFAADRITTVENAVDTRALRSSIAALGAAQRLAERALRGWTDAQRVAVYCGSLYAHKRLDLLVAAGAIVHARLPEFRLLVVGGGPLAGWMAEQAGRHAWLRYEGPRFDADKAACLAIAEVCLNPGLVGLGVLDAFCAGLPMLTTDLPIHSPEIEYLEPGDNGLVSAPTADDFAAATLALLQDPARLARLQAGAARAAERFSIETMVRNFSGGVLACLGR